MFWLSDSYNFRLRRKITGKRLFKRIFQKIMIKIVLGLEIHYKFFKPVQKFPQKTDTLKNGTSPAAQYGSPPPPPPPGQTSFVGIVN